MPAKSSRRVVIIDKIKSDMIEQAIFILKSGDNDAASAECGIVAEAQDIIESYIRRMSRMRSRERAARKRTRHRASFAPSITLAVLTLAAVISALIYAFFA